MNSINERISALRDLMKKHHLDAYYVNTADPHQSEYISAHFRDRAWLTGFTGSAGEALVTMNEALLWADGRYFIQAEKQIDGSEFRLMKKDTPGFPDLIGWLAEYMPHGSRVGMSDSSVSQSFFEKAGEKLNPDDIELIADKSLLTELWENRPPLPSEKIFHHAIEFTGLTSAEKVEKVREEMRKEDVDAVILAGLDDIAWLFNYRGNDVPNNPVALAYSIITKDDALLFIDPSKLTDEVEEDFAKNNVTLFPYEQIQDKIAELNVRKVALNKSRIIRKLYRALPKEIEVLNRSDYPGMIKACLNEVELKNQRASYIRDSAAVTRFLFWVKREVGRAQLDELNTAEKLHEIRASQENFLDESFTTISAYGANAAMMHYSATAEDYAELKPKSFYLCDSGGQYLDGTTDITRTIALGELSDEEITDFTLTVKSHIQLAKAIFLEGSTGHYLDILARQPMWKHYMDYKCGTGHAVGYVLGVHEGPQRISKYPSSVALKEGMIVTNEPGVYKAGKHGIRLENDYVVRFKAESEGDRYFCFDVLSFVPFDRDAIRVNDLDDEELEWLNHYHATVEEKLLNLMTTEEEKNELREACAPLVRS